MNQKHSWLEYSVLCSLTLLISTTANAQITPDNTLGTESSRLTPNVQIKGAAADSISGGAQRGGNLFHSFSQFNVGNGQRVYFVNPGVQNILTRVTGGQASNILGTLGVDGSANLFLLNPNGIVFGPNARLDVGGSFVGTTASAFRFGEQGVFSATNPEAPPLLTVNPSALLFNQMNPGAIANQGLLQVPNGQSLILAGGDVRLDQGGIGAFGGRVELGGLASSGTVGLEVDGNNLSLTFPDNATRADVFLTNGAIVRVDASGGGSITVNANNLDILEGSGLLAGITEGFGSIGAVAADIRLNATGEIKVIGSSVFNVVQPQAVGKGGNINVTADSLSLTDGARVFASTLGKGDAGSVFVQAKDSVSAAGNSYIFSNVEYGGVGKGGDVNINAATLSLNDGAQLSTSIRDASSTQVAGQGQAGNVNVNVTGIVTIAGGNNANSGIFSYLGGGAIGKGGNINVTSGSVSLTDGARLSASTSGKGDAGSVLVQAKNSVSAAGNSYIFSNVESQGVGKGGDVNINAATLSLTDGAQLSTSVREASSTQVAGQGQAGNVNVNVTGAVTIARVKNGFSSGILSYLGSGAIGKGGNINVTSGSVSLTDGAQLSASTSGQGDAGSVWVQAKDSVFATGNSLIFSNVENGGVGKGGDVNINAATLSLTDGAQLGTFVRDASSTQVAGQGQAGNINVNVTGAVTIAGAKNGFSSGIFSYLGQGASGKGGNITISSDSLSLTDGGLLDATTFGDGDAGSVIIDAGRVFLNGNNTTVYSIVEDTGKGKSGDILITTDSLSLTNGARLTSSTYGKGDAGSVFVQAKDSVSIDSSSYILSLVGTRAVGKGGDINVTTGSLSVTNGAQVDASTFGGGDAGNIQINATDYVNVSGTSLSRGFSSALFTDTLTTSTGKGGDLTINTGVLRVSDGAVINAGTRNDGNGGNITVNARLVETINGGQLLATSSSNGRAGKITVNATDQVIVNARDVTFNDRVAKFGNNVVANLEAASGFFVRSESTGNAGDIEVTAPQIRLDNTGRFIAESASGNGGNINLQASNFLLLRRGSLISATAGTAQQGGDGGNITINANAIVAVPKENSDISANAFQGRGGNITINTNGVFGIVPASFPTSQSDITASSQLGTPGQINLTQPDVQPASGLIELPSSVVDATTQIAQICPRSPNAKPLGEFIITGRGSLAPNPLEPLAGKAELSQLATLDGGDAGTGRRAEAGSLKASTSITEIVEAQGWVKTADGAIALVAFAPQATPSTRPTTAVCPVSQQQ
ncbi:hypothetical protein BZZ01_15585 [Nostocales cyanobacterium HT-58-2]|nr:hypothetical protein BZZ01_15585 [Nostocales cyanobacterium HT-58-2]